jgi:transcriptional regulator with XRE-family HTH domain
MTPGRLIRERRQAHGLTQAQLALRASTTQAAISRLERDELSPTFETITTLLEVLGETPELTARRADPPGELTHLRESMRRTPQKRLELALAWNRLAGEVGREGKRARAR